MNKDLGRKLIRYMKSQGWRIKNLNIVYLEDVDVNTWNPKQGRLDAWDDARIILTSEGEVLLNCEATCEPGAHYTYNPLSEYGAFRIKSNTQFLDAWEIGRHKKQHPALVQIGAVEGYRDQNKDGLRPGDKLVRGFYGINQHTCGNYATSPGPDEVGPWSAGCLVGRYPSTHYNEFMPLIKLFNCSTFDTAIIPGNKFAQFQ